MKQTMLIAVTCALVSAPLGATEAQQTGQTTATAGTWGADIATAAPSESENTEALRLAKGNDQNCGTGTSGSGGRKCGTKGGSITFPVMIGVYR